MTIANKNLFRTLIFINLLEMQYLLGADHIGSLLVFVALIGEQIININRKRRKKEGLRPVLYILVPVVLLYVKNLLLGEVAPNILIFQVSVLVSAVIYYLLIHEQEANLKKRSLEKISYISFSKLFLFFLGVWTINLLHIERGFSILTTSIMIGVLMLYLAVHYLYTTERLNYRNFLSTLIVSVSFVALNMHINEYIFDPFGITKAVVLVIILDLLDNAWEHYFYKKLQEQEWRQKLIFAFFMIVLTIQLINISTFPQVIEAAQIP